MLYYGSAVDLG